MFDITEEPTYGGFWRRAGALFLDGLITLPLLALQLWLLTHASRFPIYTTVLGLGTTLFYEVYLVQRYSGTPGKLLMGLRIVGLEGEHVTWEQALLRTSPSVILTILAATVELAAMRQVTALQDQSLTPMERFAIVANFAPAWDLFFRWGGRIWDLSELLVLMTNRKRRALHDFLASTVVVTV